MPEGLYALIGVLVGSAVTIALQMWDRVLTGRQSRKTTEANGLAGLLDAAWGRIASNVTGRDLSATELASLNTDWVLARNRFAALPVERPMRLTAWIDMELIGTDKRELTWHEANLFQGLITEHAMQWLAGDEDTKLKMDARRAELVDEHFVDHHDGNGITRTVE